MVKSNFSRRETKRRRDLFSEFILYFCIYLFFRFLLCKYCLIKLFKQIKFIIIGFIMNVKNHSGIVVNYKRECTKNLASGQLLPCEICSFLTKARGLSGRDRLLPGDVE